MVKNFTEYLSDINRNIEKAVTLLEKLNLLKGASGNLD